MDENKNGSWPVGPLTCSNPDSSPVIKSIRSRPCMLHHSRREFFDLPFQSDGSKRQNSFSDQKIVRLPQIQIFNVVANVDDYDQFLPNCIESTVINRTAKRMEAEMVVGFPPLITERYLSIVTLDKPHHIVVRGVNSKILKRLESEWLFESIDKSQTLVTFNVEFEFHSRLHSRFMGLMIDDFTKKTMQAFIERAYIIHSDPLYFDADNE